MPTVRRDEDDLNGLRYIIRKHLAELSQTQREIIQEAFLEEQPRDAIAARRGINLNIYDNHRKAASRTLRDAMTAVVDLCADTDLPDWYDRIEEMNKRHAASHRRRASRKKEKRSSSGDDRSNFEGDRSNFEGDRTNSREDRDKNARAPDLSVVVATKA